jgi:hypothetical protein
VSEPLLIVAALNGTRDRKVSKTVPYTELAKEAKAAVEAGAGIVHVHAPREDGTPVFDLTFNEVLSAIRSAVDVPISITTQRQRQTSLGTITALFSVLSELPDLATVNVAPLAPDLPAHREEARQILEALDAAGVAPEPVVPSLEGLADLAALYEDGLLAQAPRGSTAAQASSAGSRMASDRRRLPCVRRPPRSAAGSGSASRTARCCPTAPSPARTPSSSSSRSRLPMRSGASRSSRRRLGACSAVARSERRGRRIPSADDRRGR